MGIIEAIVILVLSGFVGYLLGLWLAKKQDIPIIKSSVEYGEFMADKYEKLRKLWSEYTELQTQRTDQLLKIIEIQKTQIAIWEALHPEEFHP